MRFIPVDADHCGAKVTGRSLKVVLIGAHPMPTCGAHLLLAASFSLAAGTASAAVYDVLGLGDLPGGIEQSGASDINEAGQVVGGSFIEGGSRAFLWEKGVGMTDLGVLPGSESSSAQAINDAGQVIGRSEGVGATGGPHAFLWEKGGGITDLGDLPGGNDYATAHDINNAGQIVGESAAATGSRAFLWEEGVGMTDLDIGLPDYSSPGGINDAGQVVGGVFAGATFLWTKGLGITDLGLPDGSIAASINDVGQVVGQEFINDADPDVNAILWEEGAATINLGVLPGGRYSYANDINNAGQVVGFSVPSGYPAYPRAFLWDALTGMRALDDLINPAVGWSITDVSAINEKGQIAGTGRRNGGYLQAVLLTPASIPPAAIPLPAALPLLASGLAGLLMLSRRRRG